MRHIYCILALALFVTSVAEGQRTQLFVNAPGDSLGWTIQNVRTDFQVELKGGTEQSAAIQNIACNRALLRADGLYRPDSWMMRTITIDYAPESAQEALQEPLDGATLELGGVLGVIRYAANRNLLPTQTGAQTDTLTVWLVNVETGAVTQVVGFRKEE